jgi:hypothetical protein
MDEGHPLSTLECQCLGACIEPERIKRKPPVREVRRIGLGSARRRCFVSRFPHGVVHCGLVSQTCVSGDGAAHQQGIRRSNRPASTASPWVAICRVDAEEVQTPHPALARRTVAHDAVFARRCPILNNELSTPPPGDLLQNLDFQLLFRQRPLQTEVFSLEGHQARGRGHLHSAVLLPPPEARWVRDPRELGHRRLGAASAELAVRLTLIVDHLHMLVPLDWMT